MIIHNHLDLPSVSAAVTGWLCGPPPAPFCGVTVKVKVCPGRGWGGEKVKFGCMKLRQTAQDTAAGWVSFVTLEMRSE